MLESDVWKHLVSAYEIMKVRETNRETQDSVETPQGFPDIDVSGNASNTKSNIFNHNPQNFKRICEVKTQLDKNPP